MVGEERVGDGNKDTDGNDEREGEYLILFSSFSSILSILLIEDRVEDDNDDNDDEREGEYLNLFSSVLSVLLLFAVEL